MSFVGFPKDGESPEAPGEAEADEGPISSPVPDPVGG